MPLYPPTLRSRVTACESVVYPDYLPVVFPVISGVQGRVREGRSNGRYNGRYNGRVKREYIFHM